ncbi:HIT-like domain-containing protein, partial [Dunaliella salina]
LADLPPDEAPPTIFDKIISKQIKSAILYEDNDAMAFRDISPQAPTHFLVIPKVRNGLTRLSNATEAHKMLLGHLLFVAQHVAKQEKLEPGFRVCINDGPD